MAAFEPQDDSEWLLYELGGLHRSQVLSTLAALGVADCLHAAGSLTLGELQQQVGSRQQGFESLLRAGCGLGVLCEDPPDTFRLTVRGEWLRRERLGAFAAFLGSSTNWDPWSRFRSALRDGDDRTAFERTFGRRIYDHLAAHGDLAAEYDTAIDAFTRCEAAALCARIELETARLVVDVGGGRGALLAELLAAAPHARGVLYDLPHVVEAARSHLPARADAVAGSFLDGVPANGDLYLLKHVLHNWPDDVAVRILRHCREARVADGRVVVVDAMLWPDNRPDLARMLDLEMRVLCGGRERRRSELRRLFTAAGLELVQVEELVAGSWLFVGA
ncbi:MAG TPA: hypothetical protein ENI87_14135 [bacterium]|nr:hypothetical protein [bacterium]